MKTGKFVRKPFLVDGIQVTTANMQEVAEWCQSEVRLNRPKGDSDPSPYVHVRVLRPLSPRQTMAFPGDWVLYAGTGYKVYNDKAFKQAFDPADDSDNPYYVTKLDGQKVQPPEIPGHVFFEPQEDDDSLGIFQEAIHEAQNKG